MSNSSNEDKSSTAIRFLKKTNFINYVALAILAGFCLLVLVAPKG